MRARLMVTMGRNGLRAVSSSAPGRGITAIMDMVFTGAAATTAAAIMAGATARMHTTGVADLVMAAVMRAAGFMVVVNFMVAAGSMAAVAAGSTVAVADIAERSELISWKDGWQQRLPAVLFC